MYYFLVGICLITSIKLTCFPFVFVLFFLFFCVWKYENWIMCFSFTVLNSINRACTFVRSIQWINLSNNICCFYLQKVQDMKPTYPNKLFRAAKSRAHIVKNAFQNILPRTSCLLLYIIHSLMWWWSVVIRLPLV